MFVAPLRDEKMPKIIAGMGIADMDFECAPVVTAALQKRINKPVAAVDGVLFIDHISKLKRDRVIKKFTKAAKLGKPAIKSTAD